MRIDVPEGNQPANTKAPLWLVSVWIVIDTGARSTGEPPLELSNTNIAPSRSDTFETVTITALAVGFALAIAATLTLIVKLPWATTFSKTTVVQYESIVMFESDEMITL